MNYGDFIVERTFLQTPEVKSLSATQLGILLRLFSLLAQNTRKGLWGFLIDDKGKPLSERRIRYLCGSNKIISYSTWNTTKAALIETGIIKVHKVRSKELLFCPIFVKMNTYEKRMKVDVELTSVSADFFLGYEPKDERPDKELNTWERLCRKWLAMTNQDGKTFKPPFSPDMPLNAKESAKESLVELAENMGIENTIHDMGNAFDYKKLQGGQISSMFYFMTRWKSDDWDKRHTSETQPHREVTQAKKNIKEEAEFKISKGVIKTLDEFKTYFGHIQDTEMIDQIGKELKLQ